jgi:hypothetical protein
MSTFCLSFHAAPAVADLAEIVTLRGTAFCKGHGMTGVAEIHAWHGKGGTGVIATGTVLYLVPIQ